MASDQTMRSTLPAVNAIADDQPWLWLQRGWRDMAAAPQQSLVYGGGIVLASWVLFELLWAAEWTWLVLPMAGGFLLLAPVMAVGLYEISRRLEANEPVVLKDTLLLVLRRPRIMIFGVILLLLHFAWIRTAMLWFVLYFHTGTPPLSEIPVYMLDPGNLPFLVIGTAMGAGFAFITFAVSAVSLPLLMDREIDVISAIIVSLRTILANPKAMLLWAGLIAGCGFVGLATFFFGLAVLFPLLGHATWHAYRDLVD
jgi:uncharacterized membrane protein